MKQFALQKDITKKVASRWKEVENEDVDDLLKCFIKYLKIKIEEDKEYAFKMPYLGKMYQRIQNYQNKDTPLSIEMIKEILFNSENYKMHPLYRENTLYKLRTKKLDNTELMHKQNEMAVEKD